MHIILVLYYIPILLVSQVTIFRYNKEELKNTNSCYIVTQFELSCLFLPQFKELFIFSACSHVYIAVRHSVISEVNIVNIG